MTYNLEAQAPSPSRECGPSPEPHGKAGGREEAARALHEAAGWRPQVDFGFRVYLKQHE